RQHHPPLPQLPPRLRDLPVQPGRVGGAADRGGGARPGPRVHPPGAAGGAGMTVSLRRGWITRAGIAVLLLAYGIPFLWLIATSLKTETEIFGNEAGLIFRPTFETYRAIVNGDLLQACVNSAIIAAGTTALTLALATPAAYAMARVRGALVSVALGVVIVLQITPQPASLIPLYRVLGGWNLLGS